MQRSLGDVQEVEGPAPVSMGSGPGSFILGSTLFLFYFVYNTNIYISSIS